MNIKRLTKQLKLDEGEYLRVYHKNEVKKVGIGHIVEESKDEEVSSLGLGGQISSCKSTELFLEDLKHAVETCILTFDTSWTKMPAEAQEVLVNIAFNNRSAFLSNFKIFIYHCYNHDWKSAALGLLVTRWAADNYPRAQRLSKRLANL